MKKFFKELEAYAELEGTDLGEACLLLCRLASYEDYVSDEFKKELSRELQRKLNFFKSAYRIKQREKTFIVKELEELL